MKKITIGLFFVLIALDLFNGINYMPAFIGYGLIFLGLAKAQGESAPAARTIAVASAVLTAVIWVVGLFRYGMAFPVEPTLRVLMTWRLLRWAEEQEWGLEHLTVKLRRAWYALTGAAAASFVLGVFDVVMGRLWGLAAVAAGLWYALTWNRLRRCVDEEAGA